MNDINSLSATERSSDGAALAGRILLAAIFILSGFGKVAAPDATIGYIASVGLPFPALALAGAAAVELGGGLALIAGYRTRPVALALAVFSVVTALVFHSALADENQFVHFLKNLAIAGGLFHVAAFGAGKISLDGRAGRKVRQTAVPA